MIRKLKFLGFSLVAVLAMSAVGASAASAFTQFNAEKTPVTLTGKQEGTSNAFDVQFGEVKCTTALYNGRTTETPDTTVKVTPHYTGCTFAGVSATIDMNSCYYTLHINSEAAKNVADVVCPTGEEITVTGGTKCTVHVKGQSNLGPITYANSGMASGPTREVTLGLDGIKNITYSQTPGTGVGKCESIEKSDGRYTGTAEVTGETDNGAEHIGVWVS
jgi:hypothetical protein